MSWLDNHRGPYLFCLDRPHPRKRGFATSEWLTGAVDRDDVQSEALALLSDPRDTIAGVSVWSINEQCFVGGYRKEKLSDCTPHK